MSLTYSALVNLDGDIPVHRLKAWLNALGSLQIAAAIVKDKEFRAG